MATQGPDKEPEAPERRPHPEHPPVFHFQPGDTHSRAGLRAMNLEHVSPTIPPPCDTSLNATTVQDNACGSVPLAKEKVSLSTYKISEGGATAQIEALPSNKSMGDSASVLSLDLNSQPPLPNFASTPSRKHPPSSCDYDMARDQVRFTASCKDGESSDESLVGSAGDLLDGVEGRAQFLSVTHPRTLSATKYEVLDPGEISVPIRGYEIMEQRARFTVFKVQVFRSSHDSWYVFRRYTDFVQLNDKLAVLFARFRLALPPKKWFGDNFDPEFLEDRMLGLQAFIDNITGHKEVCNSQPVREFFCFDDPPGPHDSLEESRALCEALEEKLYNTQKELQERESTISILTEERDMYRSQVKSLQSSLRRFCDQYYENLSGIGRLHIDSSFLLNVLQLDIVQRTLNSGIGCRVDMSPQSSDASLAECDQPTDEQRNEHTDSKVFCGDAASRCRSPESGIGEGIVTTPSEEGTQGMPAMSS